MAGPKNRRKRSSRKSSGSSRRGGRASAKRQSTARRVASRRAGNRARDQQISRRADDNRENYRNPTNRNKADVRTGGINTGREAGIMASQKANKIKGLEQSVGSLDRRIQNALNKGDTDTAKDLRSRLNKFTTNLGYARAAKSGGVQRDSSGRIVYTGSGNPVLNSKGKGIYDQTKDQDFLDPTRKLQNTGGDAYGKMYPIQSKIQKGLPTINAIKSFLGAEDKDIPYNLEDMPGIRYPLDGSFGAGVQEPFGGRSRDPNYRQDFFSAPLEEVTISDLVDDQSQPFGSTEILESQGIDENFIYPDGKVGNTALQLGYDDLVKAELMKNIDATDQITGAAINPRGMRKNTVANTNDFTKLENPYFFNEEIKAELNKEALANQPTLTADQIQNLDDKGVSQAYINMYPDTALTNQTLNDSITNNTNNNIDYSNITKILSGEGYNLKPDIIQEVLQYNPNLLNEADINSTLSNFYQSQYINPRGMKQ